MKKIFSIFVTSTLLMASCTLDREPETTLSDTNFWKSETDLRGACNQLYIDLTGFSNDFRSDEIIGTSQNGISSGNRNVSGTSGDWTNPYNRIGVCNNIIVKAGTSSVDEATKNRWAAEAYFFRAYNYFDLVKKYGDVPLVLKVFDNISDPDIYRARDAREEVIQQCYQDLEFALEWLPEIDKVSGDDWGRVSKSAALGLITRIALYEGTHKKYHGTPNGDYKSHLKKGLDAAEQLINGGKHDLYPDFNGLFLHAGEGRQNKENVFVKIYGALGTINHNHSRQLESTISLTRNMVDNFLYVDGLPREKSPLKLSPETSYADMLANRDPRLAMTLFTPGETAYKGAYTPFEKTSQNHDYGYAIKKGYIGTEYTSNNGTNDKMLIRYAEILVSYAELLYEYNGSITDEQLDATINKVRQRAGFNAELSNAFVEVNGLNMLDEIRRERMVEFIDENLHYDDIIRWKTAEKVLPVAILGLIFSSEETTASYDELKVRLTSEDGSYNGVKVYDQGNIYVLEEASSRSFDPERDYLYPIPTHEIATSGGNIEQNPNW